MKTTRVAVRGLRKVFATGTVALDDLTVDIRDGEFLSIVGPSGCGKTTFLRIVAGLEVATTGSVELLAVEPRPDALPTAMVFQEHALFPWMRVRQNVEFAFARLDVPAGERRRRADEQLRLVGLGHVADRFPHQLSGGMRQRVAVARAFAVDPQVLFMDEPFGALDEQTRVGLGAVLSALWERHRKTVLFVTHSIEEALALSDRVLVLHAHPGRVREIVEVPFSRPRDVIALRGDPEFARLAAHVWELLRPDLVEGE